VITQGASREAPIGYVRWTVIACVLLVATVSYLDRNNLSVAASRIQIEFGLSNVQLGVVFSSFILGYALSQPFVGRLADRLGAARTIAAALIWWSVFTALVTVIPGAMRQAIWALITVRFLLGIGEAIIFPASNRLVASWIPSQERGLANGLIFAGVGIGGGIAPPLITFIMLNHNWRWAFWLCAAIGLITCVVWVAFVRETPSVQGGVTLRELQHIQAGIAEVRSAGADRPLPWRTVVLDRQVLILASSYFCYGYVAYIFFTWFFKYLSDVRSLDLKSSAFYATLPFVAMAAASSIGGVVADRLIPKIGKRLARCGIAGLSLAAAALFIWMATRVAEARPAALVLASGAGALYFAQSTYWSLSADIGGSSAGLVSGVMNMGSQLGGVVVSSVTPIIAQSLGWTASFSTAAMVALLGAVLWAFVDPFHRLRPPHPTI
jgi:ACS family glucarate transporter-like MFS transporter